MANGKFNLPGGKTIALAAMAGAVAGALGIYVMGGATGNNGAPIAASSPAPDDAACRVADERLAAIDAAAQGEVAAMLVAQEPRNVGDLAFSGPDGTPMRLGDLSPKTTLVNLWATWCAPCRHEMPALNELQEVMGDGTFEVVAVNVDTGDDEKPRAFLQETAVDTLGYYRDSTMGIFNDLKRRGLALGLPVTLLVDGEGCLLAHMNGPAEWASPDAQRLIEAAF